MATLDQIAERAGCSRITVANVLNGRNKENWPSTIERAERIRSIALEMGYRPNSAARAVATGRFNAVGLLRSQFAGRAHIAPSALYAINDELERHGQHLTLSRVPDDSLTDDATLPRILREWSIDGLIISYVAGIPQKMVQLIEAYRIPSVWVNVQRPHDAIYPDDFQGSRDATRYLLDLGHHDIGYVGEGEGSNAHYSVAARLSGYETAMRERGLEPRTFSYLPHSPQSTWQAQASQWLGASRPTAFVCYEAIHCTALQFAAALAGLRVPQDISLVVMHELPLVWAGVEVTTQCIPTREMGQQAVRMLMEKIEQPDLHLPTRTLPLELHLGQTSGPVNM